MSFLLGIINSLITALTPKLLEKINEPTTAKDVSTPKRFRNAWSKRVRKFKSRVRSRK